MSSELLQWFLGALATGGIITGSISLFRAGSDKRKTDAETRKLAAEQDGLIVTAAGTLVQISQEQITQLYNRMSDLEKESAQKILALEKKAKESEKAASVLKRRLVELEAKMAKLRKDQEAERKRYKAELDEVQARLEQKEQLIAALRLQLGT